MQIKATAGRHFTSTTGGQHQRTNNESCQRGRGRGEIGEIGAARSRVTGKNSPVVPQKAKQKLTSSSSPRFTHHGTENLHTHARSQPPEGGNHQRRTPGPGRSKTRWKRAQPFVERGESGHLPRHGWTSEP